MQKLDLYQTLEDRNNQEYVLNFGPFKCTRTDAWLGHGFYFWEEYIDFAHLWAKNAGYGDRYLICKSAYDYDGRNYFDLVGNPKHQKELQECYFTLNRLKEKTEYKSRLTVAMVITAMIQLLGNEFNYKAIRARSEYKSWEFTLPFIDKENSKEICNLRPQVQLCVLDKSFLIEPFRIVYTNSVSVQK